MSDLCALGDIIRFTSPHDGHMWDCEVVSAAEKASQDWQRPMVFVRGCQDEPHLGILYGERSRYSGHWSVVSKEDK